MANFCLPKDRVDKFIEGLKSGELDTEELSKMTSAERRAKFAEYVGGDDAAKLVNADFESKLLLKNQNQGFVTWIRDVAGLKPEVRRDMLAKVKRLDTVLTPDEKEKFLNDLVARRLGADVTPEEAEKIAGLSQKITELESKTSYNDKNLRNLNDLAKYDYKPTDEDVEYGKSLAEFRDYTSELKNQTNKTTLADIKGKGAIRVPAHLVKKVADLSKSIGASLDNSWFGRQGNTLAFTHPFVWGKQFLKSFKDLGVSLKEPLKAHSVEDATHAALMSDPMYKQAIKDGLPLSGAKDVFPTAAPGKIPILGRAFKASEATYSAAHDLSMFSMYKQLMKKAANQGVDLGEKNASKNIANLVASMTGAAHLGALERAGGVLNVALYSARFLKSNFDQLLLHPLGSGIGGTLDAVRGVEGAKAIGFAQKQAVGNLLKVVTGIAGVLATADALMPGSVDWDPRSTDFGKIRIGDTRFDVTGGKGALVTLASRLITGKSKSSSTGKITQLGGTAPGSQTGLDLVDNFLQGKASPLGGVILDMLRGKDFSGNPVTPGGEAVKLGEPLGINNFLELLNNPNAAPVVAGVIADGLGISTNTFSPSGSGQAGSSWDTSTAKDVAAFKNKVDSTTFEKAGKEYDNDFNTWISSTRKNPAYKALSPADQATVVSQKKAKIQKQIFALNNFKYTAPKVDKNKFKALLK